MDKGLLFLRIKKILEGIDQEETESDKGYWETSTGAKFGAKKLEEIKKLIDSVHKRIHKC